MVTKRTPARSATSAVKSSRTGLAVRAATPGKTTVALRSAARPKTSRRAPSGPRVLLNDIKALINASRQRTVSTVNVELTQLFWRVGRRIHTEILAGQRAGYGEEILATLATQLVREYGRGFADKNLRRMVQFAASFTNERIVVTLSRQLSWSHFVVLLPLKETMQRDFYVQMASTGNWSVRTLRERINALTYERTALSKKPDKLIAQELATMGSAQRMSPELVMRDPYILDFLGLELYLRWLDKFEREPHEASPLGIILCTGKKTEQIELLELDKSVFMSPNI